MATYKVIQDIEAEDTFAGPLTLKQFVFGMIGVGFGYLSIFSIVGHFPYALVILVPITLLALFLAVPWSKDQPTEVWLLAKLRFMIKPRKRIWDQSGIEELVTITAPKKVEKHLTDNLSQTEVKSRLKALASTIDSRGWAVKQADMFQALQVQDTGGRLVPPSAIPQAVPEISTNNILDEYDGNPAVVANLDNMLHQSDDIRKSQALEKLDRIRAGEDLESIELPKVHFTPPSVSTSAAQISAGSDLDETALAEELRRRHENENLSKSHLRTIKPFDPSTQPDPARQQNTQSAPVANTIPTVPQPGILDYASNNDLDVATIARQAKKEAEAVLSDEVVISLH